MKVRCCLQWRETLIPSGAGGAAKGGQIRSARSRAVGEGPGVCYRRGVD